MAQRFDVRLTFAARDDLMTLHTYVKTHRSVDEAERLLDDLLVRIATLETFPLRGPVPPELAALGDHHYRQLSVPPYRLIYEVVEAVVLVSVIVDARRDLSALLARRLLGR